MPARVANYYDAGNIFIYTLGRWDAADSIDVVLLSAALVEPVEPVELAVAAGPVAVALVVLAVVVAGPVAEQLPAVDVAAGPAVAAELAGPVEPSAAVIVAAVVAELVGPVAAAAVVCLALEEWLLRVAPVAEGPCL